MKLFYKLKHAEFVLDKLMSIVISGTRNMLILFNDLISPIILLVFSLC